MTDTSNAYIGYINNVTNRRYERDCEAFLNFDFNQPERKLQVVTTKDIAGQSFKTLKVLDTYNLKWNERLLKRFVHWIKRDTNIKTISEFVQANVKKWPVKNEGQTIKLETQCAILARKCNAAGYEFNNPFKKTLEISVSFFNGLKTQENTTKIVYDRLTTPDQLTDNFNDILAKPITILVPVRSTVNGPESHLSIQTPPEKIFTNVICTSRKMIDPAKESPHSNERKVTFSCEGLDQRVLNYLIWTEGFNKGGDQASKDIRFELTQSDKEKLFKLFADDIKKMMPKLNFIPEDPKPPAPSFLYTAADQLGHRLFGSPKIPNQDDDSSEDDSQDQVVEPLNFSPVRSEIPINFDMSVGC